MGLGLYFEGLQDEEWNGKYQLSKYMKGKTLESSCRSRCW